MLSFVEISLLCLSLLKLYVDIYLKIKLLLFFIQLQKKFSILFHIGHLVAAAVDKTFHIFQSFFHQHFVLMGNYLTVRSFII